MVLCTSDTNFILFMDESVYLIYYKYQPTNEVINHRQ